MREHSPSNQLCARLRQHAALHYDLAKHSDEQAQWGEDLEAAATEIESMERRVAELADEPCKQPDAIQEIYAHAKAITNLTAAWPMEGASPPPTDALSEVVELLDQGKDFATKWNMRNSIVEALALINSHAAAAKADAEQYREWVEPQLQRLGRVTAQPPAATHTQWQRDRLATYLAKHKPALRDHACAQCVPGGEIVVEDFECCYHMALRIVGTLKTKASVPPAAQPSKEVLQAWIRDASNHIESGFATDMIAVSPVALRQMCLYALARATHEPPADARLQALERVYQKASELIAFIGHNGEAYSTHGQVEDLTCALDDCDRTARVSS